jgi:hypothetical protein
VTPELAEAIDRKGSGRLTTRSRAQMISSLRPELIICIENLLVPSDLLPDDQLFRGRVDHPAANRADLGSIGLG